MRTLVIGAAVLGIGIVVGSQGSTASSEPAPDAPQAPFEDASAPRLAHSGAPTSAGEARARNEALNAAVQQYCVVCHSDQLLTGNISLQGIDVSSPGEMTDQAERMIKKLRLEMMPPPGMPRPGGDTLRMLAETLEETIDRAAADAPNPGARRFQRLNRSEYARVIGDLLGLEINPARWLPPDVGHFDTEAAAQGLSTTALEAYLQAAEEVARIAMGVPDAASVRRTYRTPAALSQHAWDHVEGAPYGTRGGMVIAHDFPADGEYVFSVATLLGAGTAFEDVDIAIDGGRVALLGIELGLPTGGPTQTDPIFVPAGQHRVSAAFVRKIDGPYEDRFAPHDHSITAGEVQNAWANYGITALPHLQELVISGPISTRGVSDTPPRQRILSCRPGPPAEARPCAQSIVTRLATEAFRRPLDENDMTALMGFYDEAAAEGGFEVGVRTALQAILSSSSFIFRLERQPEGARAGEDYPLSDLDLASRLSFFLWATVPDEELRQIAVRGELSDPEVLEAQVRRMLKDPRSETLATRFAMQWLRMQNLEIIEPEPYYYPDFSRQLADAMRRETELFFDHLLREDRSFLDLFRADYTFVNEVLARHYGIPYSGGHEFQRVQMPDPNRRGLLGQASILTLTSMGNRTSPVLRGEFVMSVLLGSPPPPPPPNVPVLDATGPTLEGRYLTTRERMEIHRANPTCSACHQFIDPIGLALDQFDVIGQWRVRENQRPLDTRGTYYDGTVISNPVELSGVLLKRPGPLVRNFTRHLMAYAIGRRVEYYDEPTVRRVAREAGGNDYRMSSFVLGVVKSEPFRMKRVEATANQQY